MSDARRFAASDATTEAARLFSIVYMLIVTLLLAQLLMGVIVNLFIEIRRLNSEYLFTCLNRFTRTADIQVLSSPIDVHSFRVQEREAIEDDILKLNTLMLPLHEVFDIVMSGEFAFKGSDLYTSSHRTFQQLRQLTAADLMVAEFVVEKLRCALMVRLFGLTGY